MLERKVTNKRGKIELLIQLLPQYIDNTVNMISTYYPTDLRVLFVYQIEYICRGPVCIAKVPITNIQQINTHAKHPRVFATQGPTVSQKKPHMKTPIEVTHIDTSQYTPSSMTPPRVPIVEVNPE